MDGSARLFISCPKNRGFPANSGLEMNSEAHPFISWPENELAERRMVGHGRMEGWDWKTCSLGRGWSCGSGGREQAAQKKIFPVCQCELWRGLALPSENIFLYGSSSGRGEDEVFSGQNSELFGWLAISGQENLGAEQSSGPGNRPFAGWAGPGQSSGPGNRPFAGQTGPGQSSGPGNGPFAGRTGPE